MNALNNSAFVDSADTLNPVAQEGLNEKDKAFLAAATRLSRKRLAKHIHTLCVELRDPKQVREIVEEIAPLADLGDFG